MEIIVKEISLNQQKIHSIEVKKEEVIAVLKPHLTQLWEFLFHKHRLLLGNGPTMWLVGGSRIRLSEAVAIKHIHTAAKNNKPRWQLIVNF